MASEFLQMLVVVELRNPPERLRGSVTGVEAGCSLTLSNVWSIDHHTWYQRYVVDPANIVEIFEASKSPSFQYAPPQAPAPAPAPISALAPVAAPIQAAAPPPAFSEQSASTPPVLSDPAILAFRPRHQDPDLGPDNVRVVDSSQTAPTVRIQTASRHATPMLGQPAPADGIHTRTSTSTTTYTTNIESHGAVGPLGTPATIPHTARPVTKSRRRQRQRGAKSGSANENVEPASEQPPEAGRGKGWRETPMLESTASFQPFSSLKKTGRRRQQHSQDNGWASEDVTDVQEMGDFDFMESLAKFDKRTLFDQMRKEDQIDEADRLITHNRKPAPKPGTAGGKNLHYSENVLDLPSAVVTKILTKEAQAVARDFWNSDADDTGAGRVPGTGAADGAIGGGTSGDRLSGRDLGSRQNSRRGDSKVSATRRSQSRKASTGVVGQGLTRANSTAAPSAFSTTQYFYAMPSGRRLETVSALQMLNLENIAHNELGLTEDMMAENAGRGIAEVALETFADPAFQILAKQVDRSAGTASTPGPTVVILAGNNKSGIRAVAGGRHLRNKGVNVLLSVVGIERGERELLEDLRQQIRLYRNFGGRVYSKSDLFEHLRKAAMPALTIDTPRSAIAAKAPVVTLIVDALLGLAISFDELRTGDQATVYELIEWANRNEAFVLAVDVPTGIDASSGEVSIIDGARLYVRPRYVVALGAPKRGLLESMAAAETGDPTTGEATAADDPAQDWRLFVADIGLGAAVWKKAGTKIRRGIDFDDKWVLKMRYQGLEPDGESA